jgi:murein DD-endopeptidase MepM/ murein hydrolase activator NlpD
VVSADSRKLKNRGTLAAMATAAVAACALAAPAGAATTSGSGTDVPPTYGGTQFYETPTISALQCRTGCTRAANVSQTGWVSVKEKGMLRIRGRHLDNVGKVLFVGAAGQADNIGVVPSAQTSLSVDVKIPRLANNGKLVLLDPAGHSSKPSAARLRVLRDPSAASAQGLIWPVKGMITGVFGEDRGDHIHTGLDIAAPSGTPIKAAASGTVILLGWQGGYGNFTCIRHASLVTCYAHQSSYATAQGAFVRQGQTIGRVGNTGNSSGAHLHFEVRKGPAAWSAPMDPVQFLPRR